MSQNYYDPNGNQSNNQNQQPYTAYPYNAPPAYTWGPQQPPYYNPPKKSKKGKTFLKFLAIVLSCLIVSAGSVGAFVLLIQNGYVDIESHSDSSHTAAFTIYKKDPAESDTPASGTVNIPEKTPQEIATELIPSVVCVQNYQVQQNYGGFFFGYGYGDYGNNNGELTPAGEGSGIIFTEDGYIVTNQHVVDGATSLKVVTSDGLTYEAKLIGEDTQTDLAVIKVSTDDPLTPASFGDSSDLQVMDEVMAIGNPGGLELNSSVTYGRVSALNRQVTNSDTGYSIECIQTDAAINPGNSGGALVNMDGLVVGINSSKIVATGYEGLGFAIPTNLVQPVVSDLIEYGYVKDRAALGFSGQYIDSLTASFYGMSAGYYITRVTSREAQEAGLTRGDMITAIDGTQIVSSSTLTSFLVNKKPGDVVTLTVDRSAYGGTDGTVTLTLTENTGLSD